MIPTTLEIPSEYNVYNIIAENGKPLNTSNAPFEFFEEDDCGNRTPYDITAFTFEMIVTDGDCEVDTITNLFVTDTNKLYSASVCFSIESIHFLRKSRRLVVVIPIFNGIKKRPL